MTLGWEPRLKRHSFDLATSISLGATHSGRIYLPGRLCRGAAQRRPHDNRRRDVDHRVHRLGSAGIFDQAVLVESWSEFASQFGNLYSGVYLGYAVNAFFANGGSQAYIIRIVDPTAAAASVDDAIGSATLYASSPGTWGDSLEVQVVPQTGSTTNFTLNVIDARSGNVLESWANLSLTPSDPRYAKTVIDADSQYVTFIDATSPAAPVNLPSTISVSTIPALSGLAVTAESGGSLPPSTTYWYTVTAIYSEGESEPVTPDDSGTTTATTKLALQVSWTSAPFNGKQPTGFRVLRGTAAGAENEYCMVPAGQTTLLDDGTVTFTAGSAQPATSVPLLLGNGSDGSGVLAPNTAGFETALLNNPSGIYLLDRVPIFNLLCVPGETTPAMVQQLQAYCAANRAVGLQLLDGRRWFSPGTHRRLKIGTRSSR